eukprot:Gb_09675 [translate_table: standard]
MPKIEGKYGTGRLGNSPDSAFKLFGRTIPVHAETGRNSSDSNKNDHGPAENVCGKPSLLDDAKTSNGEEINDEVVEKQEEKQPKKPSSPMPCPRCESMDTKFCYFNNYNVNQPRHYCRNCQRYWTAGGSLRNVPVGAGRRKNKPCLGIHQRHIIEDNESVWIDEQNCIPFCPSGNSEKMMKSNPFAGQLGHFVEPSRGAASSMEGNPKLKPDDYSHSETLNLPDIKAVNEVFLNSGKNRVSMPWPQTCTLLSKGLENIHKANYSPTEKTQMSPDREDSIDVVQPENDMVCASSVTVCNSMAQESSAADSESNPQTMSSEPESKADDMAWKNGYRSMSFVGSPWPLYSNGCWGSVNGIGGVQTNGVPWCQPGLDLLPGVKWPLSSGEVWGQAWGLPWRPANAASSPTSLGKHQREEAPLSECKSDRSLWIPKTLRMDDPGEATKSCIWANLGQGSKPQSISSGGIFKAFQPRVENIESAKASPVQLLCANPAALSRSASFLESS